MEIGESSPIQQQEAFRVFLENVNEQLELARTKQAQMGTLLKSGPNLKEAAGFPEIWKGLDERKKTLLGVMDLHDELVGVYASLEGSAEKLKGIYASNPEASQKASEIQTLLSGVPDAHRHYTPQWLKTFAGLG